MKKIKKEFVFNIEEVIKQRVYEVYDYIKREQEYTELEFKKTLKEAIDTAYNKDMTKLLSKNNEAFYEWYWYNPTNPDIQRKKIGLVKNFKTLKMILL